MEVERIKGEIELVRVVEAAGVELVAHGQDLIGRCPFHDDRSPSLVITPSKNLWHCLGACQTGGSVIDWVMKAEAVSFRHAVELLKERHFPSLVAEPRRGRPARDGRVYPKHSLAKKLPVFLERSAEDEVLMRQVVSYYHETLKQSPEALLYLEKRGLRSSELVEQFQLGFSNRTLGYRLPGKQVQAGAELRGRLQQLGVYSAKGHELFNGSLVVPIVNSVGEVTEMYGRKINDHLRAGTAKHLYLPGPHRGVWNEAVLSSSKEVILCESLIDAMTFWCAGFRHVTTSYGVEGFTDDHRAAFRRYGTERVLIAYDRDEAGDRAAAKLSSELNAMGVETLRVLFPKGMDANEYALKVGPAEQSLRLVLQNAEWLGGVRPVSAGGIEPPALLGEVMASSEGNEETAKEESGCIESSDGGAERVPEKLFEELWEAVSRPTTVDVEVSLEVNASEGPDAVVAEAAEEVTFPSLAAEGVGVEEVEAQVLSRSRKATSLAAEQASPEGAERVSAQAGGDELQLTLGDRRWRIRGLMKNTTPSVLRINALVARGECFHVDTLELYSARQRGAYITQASTELGVEERVIKRDLGVLLLKLEERQEQAQKQRKEPERETPKLSEAEQKEALELLKDPTLLDRIVADLETCGIVGERVNKLTSYLAAVSRKLERPLAVVIQSSSAAGKSSLMEAVLKLVPEEERVAYSAMTAQSLFYMGQHDLKHKVLAIAEEEGAKEASYALKLLQSEGRVKIASTTKDPQTGQFVTRDHELEGPVMIFLTTTAIEVDEELLNRCIVLTVDEGREQTRAIHELQRQARTLQGLIVKEEQERIVRLHQNAQRLLRALPVVNPFASQLKFPDHQTRMRRDHTKYLALIEAVALLHQYQRPIQEVAHRGKTLRYVEVTASDIEHANRLACEVLRVTTDDLPPQTRALLGQLDALVMARSEALGMDRSDYRFSRREAREWTRLGLTQLRVHLERLVEMEYVVVHRAGPGRGHAVFYELAWSGDMGTNESWRGFGSSWRGDDGGLAGAGSAVLGSEKGAEESDVTSTRPAVGGVNGREHRRAGMNGASYPPSNRQAYSNGRAKTLPLDVSPR